MNIIFKINRINLNLDNLFEIYNKNGDINTTDVNGWPLLIWASERGDIVLVENLLIRGADIEKAGIDPQTYTGGNALDIACSNGNLEIVKKLIEYGANIFHINIRSKNTPLIYAVINNHIDIVVELLKYMTLEQINHKSCISSTALDMAIYYNYTKIIDIIKNKINKIHIENKRHIKNVIFKVFEAIDKDKKIEVKYSPAQDIAIFLGIPKGLCSTKKICSEKCNHYSECSLCSYITKYKSSLIKHHQNEHS